MDAGANGAGFQLTTGHYFAINHQPYADRGTNNNLDEKFRIASSGQIGLSGANYGTSGQVLTSGGANSAPSWQTASGGDKGQKGEVGAAGADNSTKGQKGEVGADNSTKGQKGEVGPGGSATISNNADNRVITGGSGTNLNAEANLTFDGSNLTINGDAIFTGDNYNAQWNKSDNELEFKDNTRLGFGDNGSGVPSDLTIKHNTTVTPHASQITNRSDSQLEIIADMLELRSSTSDRSYLTANVGAATTIFHSNTVRLETTTSGAKVTGNLEVTGTITGTVASIPSGTRMLFNQTSAPTGWTKDTSSTNRALRLVSGTVGTGGVNTFTGQLNASVTTSGGSVSNHTLTTAQLPAHFHNVWTRNETNIDGSRGTSNQNTADHHWTSSGGGYRQVHIGGGNYAPTSSNTGSGNSHNHGFTNPSFNLNIAYTDVIIAQKD